MVQLPRQVQIFLEYCEAFIQSPPPRPEALPHSDAIPPAQDIAVFEAMVAAHLGRLQRWVERVSLWTNHTLNEALACSDTPEPVLRDVYGQLAIFNAELELQRTELSALAGSAAMRAAAPRLDGLCHDLQVTLRSLAMQAVADLDAAALQARVDKGEPLAFELEVSFEGSVRLAEFQAWCEACRKQVELEALAAKDGAAVPSADHWAGWLILLLVFSVLGVFFWAFGENALLYLFLTIAGIGLLIFVFRYPLALLLAILGSCAFGS